ncbi:MAG: hypothetical protein COX19_09690 [Desulfobacterales bacterium CG23_combo_of_CG06-09_8_20_14_all_51_8]|nr:MAG: hypothetical protein COX19_09690 [Desulfobacterales bacterium CG23_combo_of_CG06-09_8_20_14_all_51_8]
MGFFGVPASRFAFRALPGFKFSQNECEGIAGSGPVKKIDKNTDNILRLFYQKHQMHGGIA